MKGLQFRFLQITESVEYFLPFVRPKHGQEIQDFSFAHAESLRPGTPKDKRSRLDDALQSLRHVSRAASDQCPQDHDLTGAKVLWCKHDILLDRPLSGRTAGWAI